MIERNVKSFAAWTLEAPVEGVSRKVVAAREKLKWSMRYEKLECGHSFVATKAAKGGAPEFRLCRLCREEK